MHLGARSLHVAVAMAVVACSGGVATPDAGGDGPTVDLFEAICTRRITSPDGCSAECDAAVSSASTGACAAQVIAVNESSEFAPFGMCAAACPSALTCPTAGALTDCACGAACVRMRAPGFQAAFEAMASCLDEEIAGACY